jgi:hypothetical protein
MFNHVGILVFEAVPFAVCMALYAAYRARVKSQFSDRYYRSVPAPDHPAVLGVLSRGAISFGDDMAAALMRLVALGKLRVKAIERQSVSKLGRCGTEYDYRLVKIEDIDDSVQGDATSEDLRSIDCATMDFLFKSVALHGEPDDKPWSSTGQGSEESIVLSEVTNMARMYPYEFWDAYERWGSSVNAALESRGYMTKRVEPYSKAAFGSFLLYLLLLLLHVAFFITGKANSYAMVVASILLNTLLSVACILVYAFLKPMTQEGAELRAKLRALRNWLEDFSCLNEGVSTNAKYWSKLLTVATALGVVDRSVEQLQHIAPTVLKDPLVSSCNWDGRGSNGMSCVREIRSILDKTYSKAYMVVYSKRRHVGGFYKHDSLERAWLTIDGAR